MQEGRIDESFCSKISLGTDIYVKIEKISEDDSCCLFKNVDPKERQMQGC